MYTLEFTERDLEANQQGLLSEFQQKRLDADVDMIRRQGKTTIKFFGIFFVFIVVVGLISEYNNAHGDLEKLFSRSNLTGFAIAGVLFTFLLVVGVVSNWWSVRSLSRASIRTVEGIAHVVTGTVSSRGGRYPVYNVEIRRGMFSKTIFRFQNDASLRYFTEGRPYRVYYLKYVLPVALSAEELVS